MKHKVLFTFLVASWWALGCQPSAERCHLDGACAAGQICMAGACVAVPVDPTPASPTPQPAAPDLGPPVSVVEETAANPPGPPQGSLQITPTSPAEPPVSKTVATGYEITREEREQQSGLADFDSPDAARWADAARLAQALCRGKQHAAGFWSGHFLPPGRAGFGLICLDHVVLTEVSEASLSAAFEDDGATGAPLPLDQAHWARAGRVADALCRKKGQASGLWNGFASHAGSDGYTLVCLPGVSRKPVSRELVNAAQSSVFIDTSVPDETSWSAARRNAVEVCQIGGHLGGFFTGHFTGLFTPSGARYDLTCIDAPPSP